MRLAFVYQFLTVGGVSVQLRNRLAALRSRGVEATCCFLYDRGGRPVLADVAKIVIERSPRALVGHLLATEPDVVVTIDTPQVLPAMRKSVGGQCWVNELHSTTAKTAHYGELGRLKDVRAHIVPSEYMHRRARDEWHLPADRLRVIPNGIDMEVFRPGAADPGDGPVVLWVGKLDSHKNWRGFLRVCEAVAQQRPDARFWVVGGDTAGDHVVEQFAKSVVAAGVQDRARWIDRVEYDRMPDVYAAAAASGGLLLSTSRDESFGMTVLEAMACGCPVVVPEVGALPELVSADATGECYASGDMQGAVEVVMSLLSEGPRRWRLAERAKAFVRSTFDHRQVAERYLEMLSGVVSRAV